MLAADNRVAHSRRGRPVALQARRRAGGAGPVRDGLRADLRAALASESATWVQGRARVELARVALAKGDSEHRRRPGASGPRRSASRATTRSASSGARKMAEERQWPVESRPGSGSSSDSILAVVVWRRRRSPASGSISSRSTSRPARSVGSHRRQGFRGSPARFVGQKPLVELDSHGNFVRSNPDRTSPTNGRVPEQLNVMAFDADDGAAASCASRSRSGCCA